MKSKIMENNCNHNMKKNIFSNKIDEDTVMITIICLSCNMKRYEIKNIKTNTITTSNWKYEKLS